MSEYQGGGPSGGSGRDRGSGVTPPAVGGVPEDAKERGQKNHLKKGPKKMFSGLRPSAGPKEAGGEVPPPGPLWVRPDPPPGSQKGSDLKMKPVKI